MVESKFTNPTSTSSDRTNLMDFYFTEDDDAFEDYSLPISESISLEDNSENLERYLVQTDDHDPLVV